MENKEKLKKYYELNRTPLKIKEEKPLSAKFILDACCGGRMFWFNKKHPNTIYVDIRKEEKGFIKYEKNYEVNPDIIADVQKLPFKEKSFKLIIFDPPHLVNYNSGIMFQKYGSLNNNYKDFLSNAFKELWRVLDDYGVINFKWNNQNVKIREILEIIKEIPLCGTKAVSKKNSNTYWFCFMKIPEEK